MNICPYHKIERGSKGNCKECARETRNRLYNEAIKHYGGKCAYCGQSNKRILQLHHANNDGAERKRELVGNRHYTHHYVVKLKKLGWPDDHGLEIVCANCHYELTRYGEATWFK